MMDKWMEGWMKNFCPPLLQWSEPKREKNKSETDLHSSPKEGAIVIITWLVLSISKFKKFKLVPDKPLASWMYFYLNNLWNCLEYIINCLHFIYILFLAFHVHIKIYKNFSSMLWIVCRDSVAKFAAFD